MEIKFSGVKQRHLYSLPPCLKAACCALHTALPHTNQFLSRPVIQIRASGLQDNRLPLQWYPPRPTLSDSRRPSVGSEHARKQGSLVPSLQFNPV